ncbi:MAG TPA: hypothetical protein VGN09_16105 [Vicinamibacteria bacterium]|jgi:YVTN family beta-propeller protein
MNRFHFLAIPCLAASLLASPGPAAGTRSILYVDNSEGTTLTLIDTASLGVVGEITVGEKPHGLVASRDGRRVYASVESTNQLLAIDPGSRRIIGTAALGKRPNQISVSADGHHVYVPLRGEAGLQVIDTSTMQAVKRLDVPDEPHNSYASASGRHIYLGCMSGKSIVVIDARSHVIERRIAMPAPVRPIAIKDDESIAYVALSDLHGFAVLDLATDKIVQRVELPKLPPDTPRPYLDTYTHGLALTPDENELWVTSVPDGRLYVFSVPALQPRGEVAVGKFPNWLAFTPDGKTLFVSNAESHTVTAIDVPTRSVRGTIAVGRAPKRLIVVPRPTAS